MYTNTSTSISLAYAFTSRMTVKLYSSKQTYIFMGHKAQNDLLRQIRDEGKWGDGGMSEHLLATMSPPE